MWSCNFILEKYFWLGEAEQVKENTLMKPLNHSMLLFAIQGNPIENIRQLQCKQTVCYSAPQQQRPVYN